MDSKKKSLKRRALRTAIDYCNRMNYNILETNWKSQAGKVDIIAIDDTDLVLIDVDVSGSLKNGFPEPKIDHTKRATHEMIALEYLSTSNINNVSVRFDVIAVVPVGSEKAMVRHHVNAFGVA